jgi:hypothetical protein
MATDGLNRDWTVYIGRIEVARTASDGLRFLM